MPTSREKSWADLRIGIAVTAVFALAGVAVFLAGARRGPFLPDTYTLYLKLSEAGGVRVGSPVRVRGIPAGEVADVEIIAPESSAPGDTLEALTGIPELADIRLELSVQERFRPYITAESRAQLATIGAGGERYVQISAGTVGEEPVPDGGEIVAIPSTDWDLILARLSRAFNEMAEIAEIAEGIRGKLESGGGSLPRFLDKESRIYAEIEGVRRESESLLALVEEGPGLIPRWYGDPRLKRNLGRLTDDLDSLAVSLDAEDGALGRWTRSEELRTALADAREEVRRLDEAVASGRGTWGRLANDEELWVQIRVLQRRVADLVAAIKADPLGSVDIDLF